jgi:hypothetical protein
VCKDKIGWKKKNKKINTKLEKRKKNETCCF